MDTERTEQATAEPERPSHRIIEAMQPDDECGCERLDDGECGCLEDRLAREAAQRR